jgi:hypothetical protein
LIFSSSFRFTITETVTDDLGGVAFKCSALEGAAFSLPGSTTRASAANCGGLTCKAWMPCEAFTENDLLRGELLIDDLFPGQVLSRKTSANANES